MWPLLPLRWLPCELSMIMMIWWWNKLSAMSTVLLLKSFHIGRSFFLLTGRHYSLSELTHNFSMFKEFPIKIFLLKSQKWRQLRQSNLPPLFARRRSASYWAKSEMQPVYITISNLSTSPLCSSAPPPPASSNQEFGTSKTDPDVQFWILAGPKIFVCRLNVNEKVFKILHFHILPFFGRFWAKQSWSFKIVIIIIGRTSNTTGH